MSTARNELLCCLNFQHIADARQQCLHCGWNDAIHSRHSIATATDFRCTKNENEIEAKCWWGKAHKTSEEQGGKNRRSEEEINGCKQELESEERRK